MAKATGLGKGLGALLKETSVSPASVTSVGALKTKTASQGNLPDCIEVDENGGLWIDPALLIPNPQQPRVEFNQKQLEELAESIKVNGILQPIIIDFSAIFCYN